MKRPQQFCSAVMMMWLLLSSCDQKQETEQILTATDSFGSTARLISAFKRCPDQRKRKSVTPRNPLTCLSASEISSITSGSTPSSNRLNTGFPDCHTIGRIAAVITSPTIGSANGYPNHTPTVAQETVDSYGKTYSEEIEKLVALTRKAYESGEMTIFEFSVRRDRFTQARARSLDAALAFIQALVELAAQAPGCLK